jgi:hypothetical protein
MTDGRELMELLRPLPIPERESALLQFVMDGDYASVEFGVVQSAHKGHTASISVMTDTLKIGTENSVRIPASATLCQQLADYLGLMMPTTRIFDLMWRQGSRLEPATQYADPADRKKHHYDGPPYFSPEMDDVGASLKYHDETEREITGLTEPRSKLLAHGKIWALDNRMTSAKVVNYGFASNRAPSLSASGIRMWQPASTRHNRVHADYSQVVRMWDPRVLVDGEARDAHELLTDPELAGLVSDQGVLKVLRVPGVEELQQGAILLSEVTITAAPPPSES